MKIESSYYFIIAFVVLIVILAFLFLIFKLAYRHLSFKKSSSLTDILNRKSNSSTITTQLFISSTKSSSLGYKAKEIKIKTMKLIDRLKTIKLANNLKDARSK